ncbi:Peptidase M54 archaemetzincin [Penicillium brevicompactum]|uniref:Peptidase M54 archaemetzincin n=1 Tax=Penicillium brevicompactum TaxID=5074 RepID=A0A9W9QI25_PENBR|nr:Peptidase M54 archaemetzincin [Penicillium brevicompactum]
MPKSTCCHSQICLSSSSHAPVAGYKRPSERQRTAATKSNSRAFSGKDKRFLDSNLQAFPAPLILPGDDLAGDPEESQSFQEWVDGGRNPVTPKRRTIYVVPSPPIDPELNSIQKWTQPRGVGNSHQIVPPSTEDIKDYLAAFYHGLPVKMMPPSTLRFTPWDEAKKKSRKPAREQYLGLDIGDECVRIRARTLSDGVYSGQLNLDDLLDAAISLLPKDAYALILLVDFDLYEDEDDEFVCGRAYGGSRVAVVSSARYNPILDTMQQVEHIHAWPASHCGKYVASCAMAEPSSKKPKLSRADSKAPSASSSELDGPVKDAVLAYKGLPEVVSSSSLIYALWLGRMCRTASHELGHCFGIAHCVYYACSMQGSASICEDARQPPYLCPVDLVKVLSATGSSASDRYEALLTFCERPGNVGTHFFAPFSAWIRSRVRQIEDCASAAH